ncbi:MAG: metallophosphoesterase family protein [Oscillochloridaceae bacterium umkhey_bin13]
MPYRILHVSDLHTGPPFRPAVADDLVRQAHELAPDLLVISGDFVQRADFSAQWRTANALRAALPQPQLVVPGNHDVPLVNAAARLLRPMSAYQRQISADLNPVFERPGLVVVGANTSHGLTGDGGWLSDGQARVLRHIFGRYDATYYKIVVWHHPVVNPPNIKRNRVMLGATKTMRLLDELAVDMLLCGHVHVGYVSHTSKHLPGLKRGTLICQSGTTTSRRGYGPEHEQNTCNLITLDEQTITIQPMRHNPEQGHFEPTATHAFRRNAAIVAPHNN